MSEFKTVLGVLVLLVSLSVLALSATFFYFTQPDVLKANAISSLDKAYQSEPPPDKIGNLIEEAKGKHFIERKSISGYAFKFYSDKIRVSTQENIGAYFGSELFSQGYYRNFPTESASVFELAMSQYGNSIFMLLSIVSFLFSMVGLAILYMNNKRTFEISKYFGASLIVASLPIFIIPFFRQILTLPEATGVYSAALQYFLTPLSSTFILSYAVAISAGIVFSISGAYFERKFASVGAQKTIAQIASPEKRN